jgi:replication-associated recombination protein RarA
MRYFRVIVFTQIMLLFGLQGFSQDSLYAETIDSLWMHSYDPHLLSKTQYTAGNTRIVFSYYKSSGKMRSIVRLDKSAKENLLFFYLEDKPVMISPSGQQPYFILNDSLVWAAQLKHTPQQIQELIARAYDYLESGYKKINE